MVLLTVHCSLLTISSSNLGSLIRFRHINRETLEVVERSLEVRIRNGHVKWKGSGALLSASVHELPRHIIILLASVSSVHRFVFPRPEEVKVDVYYVYDDETDDDSPFQKVGEGRDPESGFPSVFAEASESQSADPKNNHVISHYANSSEFRFEK